MPKALTVMEVLIWAAGTAAILSDAIFGLSDTMRLRMIFTLVGMICIYLPLHSADERNGS